MTIELRIKLERTELETLLDIIDQQQSDDKLNDGYYMLEELNVAITDNGNKIIVASRGF